MEVAAAALDAAGKGMPAPAPALRGPGNSSSATGLDGQSLVSGGAGITGGGCGEPSFSPAASAGSPLPADTQGASMHMPAANMYAGAGAGPPHEGKRPPALPDPYSKVEFALAALGLTDDDDAMAAPGQDAHW